jgi:hypothetical protein
MARRLGVLLLLTLAGCATTPTASPQATPVPANRLLVLQEAAPDRTAKLIVTRDQGFVGSGCYLSFLINGVHAGRFDVGETAQFHVAPGELVLGSRFDLLGRGLCGGREDVTLRETLLRSGETKHFRLSIDSAGKTDVQRSGE